MYLEMNNLFYPFVFRYQANHSNNYKLWSKTVSSFINFLWKLNIFNDGRKMMSLFYQSFIQSALTFSFITWYGNVSVKDKNHLRHIVKTAGKVIFFPFVPGNVVFVLSVLLCF